MEANRDANSITTTALLSIDCTPIADLQKQNRYSGSTRCLVLIVENISKGMIYISIFNCHKGTVAPPVRKMDPWQLPRTKEQQAKINTIENEIIDIVNKSNITNDEFRIILHDLEKTEKDPIIKLNKRLIIE